MSKRSTPTDKILVDPIFNIPEGAEDQFAFSRDEEDSDIIFETDEETSSALEESVSDDYYEEYDFGEDDYETEFDEEEESVLETPTAFQVISQKLRRAPGGQQVVDIIIDVEDIDEAVQYEIQVTKI